MLKNAAFLIILFLLTFAGNGQTGAIKGYIRNYQTTAFIPGATVIIKSIVDTTYIQTRISDSLGRFQFNDLQLDSFRLSVSSVGFSPLTTIVRSDTAMVDLGAIDLKTASGVLAGVTVTATVPMAVQKADTVQYNASQFKVNPDASAEDLVKKMPGITSENGTVTAHGETVQKVTIDGRELFGDDATAALRNLPAEIIDKIQVFDRLSDQAQFTGFDDGSSQKGINIITKANMRNGQFGRVFAGYGTDARYQAGGNSTILQGDRKIALVANFNNVNAQNFASQDLLGVTGGGGGGFNRGGGGPRGGGGGRQRGGGGPQGGGGFGGDNFQVAQQNGINKTNAAGINYSDNWGPKLNVTGSYFFNQVHNNTNQLVNTQYARDDVFDQNQKALSNSRNTNNRLQMRIEYKIDSFNQLIITPSISLQNNNTSRNSNIAFFSPKTSRLTSTTNTINNSATSGNNLNNNILFRHSFRKRGRTFSVNLTTSGNNRNGDVYTNLFDTTFIDPGFVDSSSRRYTRQLSNGYQIAGNIIYTEPIGKMSQLQINYNPTFSRSKADQEGYVYEETSNKYSLFDPKLSSKFDNTYSTQNGGIGYRYGNRDNQISFGVNYQRSNLHSDQTFPRVLTVDKSFNNILPNFMARVKLSSRSNVRLFYRTNVNQPSVTQLQDVYDITNSPFITAGNPQLNQQVTSFVSTRYTYTNPGKGILFVGNVFVQTANNYITNATFSPLRDSVLTGDLTLKQGQTLTKPMNVNGYLSLRSFLNFAFPIKVIKSNINLNGGISYSKLPGIINYKENLTKNTTYTAGAVIASNVSEYVDFTVSYSANISKVNNELQKNSDGNYFSQVTGVQLNLLSKSGWFFQNQVNNQLYSGLTAGYNQNYFLWNMAAGKKFLKNQKGELKLSVFDLLKQNRSISRNVESTYVEDVQNQVLQQYFMITFTYNLRNFGAGVMNTNRPNRNFGPRF